jgi:hypothetical protein
MRMRIGSEFIHNSMNNEKPGEEERERERWQFNQEEGPRTI